MILSPSDFLDDRAVRLAGEFGLAPGEILLRYVRQNYLPAEERQLENMGWVGNRRLDLAAQAIVFYELTQRREVVLPLIVPLSNSPEDMQAYALAKETDGTIKREFPILDYERDGDYSLNIVCILRDFQDDCLRRMAA